MRLFRRGRLHQLHDMTTQLARVERQDVTTMRKGRASAVRMEASALRRDIKEAQALIDQRRYLNGEERTQQHPAGRQRSGAADDCYISGFTESRGLGR